MSAVVLPELEWAPTKAFSSRRGARVRLVVVHRWGAPYKNLSAEQRSYHGVVNYFKNPANGASAHFVMPGSAEPGRATQMVARADKAWTEAFYNPVSSDFESADAHWLGHDPAGLHVLARAVAFELRHYNLPPVWVHGQPLTDGHGGFCRHADLGSAGGGHTSCPTTDLSLWAAFVAIVQHEHHRGGFRPVWGR